MESKLSSQPLDKDIDYGSDGEHSEQNEYKKSKDTENVNCNKYISKKKVDLIVRQIMYQ